MKALVTYLLFLGFVVLTWLVWKPARVTRLHSVLQEQGSTSLVLDNPLRHDLRVARIKFVSSEPVAFEYDRRLTSLVVVPAKGSLFFRLQLDGDRRPPGTLVGDLTVFLEFAGESLEVRVRNLEVRGGSSEVL